MPREGCYSRFFDPTRCVIRSELDSIAHEDTRDPTIVNIHCLIGDDVQPFGAETLSSTNRLFK